MLVKLDIEGLESAILRLGEVLNLHAPLIMAEMLSESERHMLCSLESLGYETRKRFRWLLVTILLQSKGLNLKPRPLIGFSDRKIPNNQISLLALKTAAY